MERGKKRKAKGYIAREKKSGHRKLGDKISHMGTDSRIPT